jgi:glycosyltransferase involved in cell wall biosynthesis
MMATSDSSVSVIIPAFNASGVIGDCLQSLLDQEDASFEEIIVVDNGSADGTAGLVRGTAGVRYLLCETPGASAARNTGARESSGAILAFLDADCRADPAWLSGALAVLAEDEKADGLVGRCTGINANLWAEFAQRRYERFVEEIQGADGRLMKIDSKNFFIRKKVFDAVGGFDTGLGNSEDADLGIRLHRAGYRIVYGRQARIGHLNPQILQDALRTRREQGYYDYFIFKKYPPGEGGAYYPALVRGYARRLFDPGRSGKKPWLKGLIGLAGAAIRVSSTTLRVLRAAGLGRRSFPLYKFLMDCAIFQGKLYGCAVHGGRMTREEVGSKNQFSRRIL